MTCRLATSTGYQTKTKEFSYPDILRLVAIKKRHNTKIMYNEVTRPINKLFFDIDDSLNLLNFNKCRLEIEKQISLYNNGNFNIQLAYTKSTNENKPHSYHLVYQVKSPVTLNLQIAKKINQIFKFDILDEAVYSGSLRLPNCPKYDTKSCSLVQVYHEMVQGTVE